MNSITLKGMPTTIEATIGIINSLNKDGKFNFTYEQDTVDDQPVLTIYAPEPEHFYVLGGFTSLFLKETMKPIAAQIIGK